MNMKLLSFLVLSFVILAGIFSILLLTDFKVFAQGTYPIIVNVKFTENGSAKTFSSASVKLLDGESGAQIYSTYANGASVYLNGKPASLKVTIEAKESGSVVYTNTSDPFTSLPDDKFTYTPTLEVSGIITGPNITTTPSIYSLKLHSTKSTYTEGENVTICYDVTPNSSFRFYISKNNIPIVDFDEDGSNCFQQPVLGTMLGTNTYKFEAKINNVVVATETITVTFVGKGTPTPSVSPTPPTEGAGWCGDDASVRAGFLPVPSGSTPPCAMKDAVYVPRATPKDAYCDKASSGTKPYFYKCSAGSVSGTPTPTPTPFKKALEGEACIPSQGPWQCMQNNYCAQTCTSFGASCTTGKCCPDNKVWLGTTCGVPASTPTPTPAGAKPTPIATAGKCDDVILTAAGSVSQACVKAASCTSPDIENAGGSETCSQFYGGAKTGYVCCQKPVVNSGAVGSSCSVTNRLCDTNLNSSTGTNTQCTGCGGYCIKPSGATEAFCQSI